jgi:L-asparaginase
VPALPRIRLVAVGGTISCLPQASTPGTTPSLTAADIVEATPELGALAELELADFATIASFAVTPTNMRDLAAEVVRAIDDGCNGVVVTHGTDTIEESAYALALMVPRGRPVVLTGAMRGPSLPGTEGAGNLVAAMAVAADERFGETGPVVVLNDEVHAARFAAKSHTTRLSTFASAGAGPLGEVAEHRPHLWFRPIWDDYLGLPASLDGVEVEIVRMVSGAGDSQLRDAIARRPGAIVIDGFGGGHVAPPVVPAVADAIAAGIPVVMAPRPPGGRTLERTYGMPGAEMQLVELGVIPAGHLPPHKTRLRLLVGLALGRKPSTLFPVS